MKKDVTRSASVKKHQTVPKGVLCSKAFRERGGGPVRKTRYENLNSSKTTRKNDKLSLRDKKMGCEKCSEGPEN